MPSKLPKQFSLLPSHFAGVEAVQAQSRHQFGRHMHGQFGIGVITQGGQKSFSGRGMVEAVAGDTITVNPGEIHDGSPMDDTGRRWQMLYLEPELVATLMDDISAGKRRQAEFSLPVIRNTRISQAVRQLFATMTTPQAASISAEEQMLLLFSGIMQEPASQLEAVPASVHHARSLIDDDPAADLSLQALAQQQGLSRFQLLRAFAKSTGMTPHAYILQRRLQLARRLIAGGMPLVQVAMECGFADQSHMTRLFVRHFGVSPGIYALR